MGWSVDPAGTLAAFLILIAGIAGWRYFREAPKPAFYYPTTEGMDAAASSFKTLFHSLPKIFLGLSFLSLLAALADPKVTVPRPPQEVPAPLDVSQPSGPPPPVEGLAIYLVLDQSGSMAEEILTRDAQGRRSNSKKLNILKTITEKFIKGDPASGLDGRPDDMIGIVAFARSARVLSPLTLDHGSLLKKLRELEVVQSDDQQGTSIGYAIFKTANLIVATRHFAEKLETEGKPAYTIRSAVIVLVTDGLQENNPLDKGKKWRLMPIEEAASYAAANGIKLYIINVDPKFGSPEYAPERREMERNAAKSGGKFFIAGDKRNLAEIYSEIDELEKSHLPSPQTGRSVSKAVVSGQFDERHLYKYLAGLALLLLMASVFLETLWTRSVP